MLLRVSICAFAGIVKICFNDKCNYACNNGENDSDCDIYAYMARMSSNDEWKNHGTTEY